MVAPPEPVIVKAPPPNEKDDGVSIPLMIAIILGVVVLLCVIAIIILCYRDTHRKQTPQDIHMHNYNDVVSIFPRFLYPSVFLNLYILFDKKKFFRNVQRNTLLYGKFYAHSTKSSNR